MAENDTTTDASAPSEASPLLISTQSGLVQGLNRDHDAVFYGIPYAAPVSGIARFEAPQSPHTWEGVRDCTKPGPTAQDFLSKHTPTIPEPVRRGAENLTSLSMRPKTLFPSLIALR